MHTFIYLINQKRFMLTSFNSYRRIRYPTQTQVEIWDLKRNRILGKKIAKQKEISPAFVSKAFVEAKKRIKALLEETARSNKTTLGLIDESIGFAKGYNHTFNVTSYITFSPKNGIQVWYDHEGECVECERYGQCRKIILQEYKERNIKIDNPQLRPTDLGKQLFEILEERAK
ncbi:MAG: hypothetical protein JSV04_08450 [Candidatus Heimdallarchaeota archaeon]|nr:MAG: hypothetical protein JSV04_08450 [Candidatus Heimdallarchaeota archaeon]